MIRRLTRIEAEMLVEIVFETTPDTEAMNFMEFSVLGIDKSQAQADVDSYLANLPDEIDPKSIRIINDVIDEDRSTDCVTISIHTESAL